jgi:HEAT repeat protein
MAFKLYVCGELQSPREKRHVDLVLKSLSDKYGDSPSNCVVFVAGKIPFLLENGTQIQQEIDLIVIKDGRAVILEHKNLSGEIFADCSRSAWVVNGAPLFLNGKPVNPLPQIRRERGALNAYFSGYILQRFKQKDGPDFEAQEERTRVEVGRKISAWVVTNIPSTVHVVNLPPEDGSWFGVFPANQVADALVYEGEKVSLLTREQLDLFASQLGARSSTLEDWLMKAPQVGEAREAPSPRIPVVDSRLRSGRDDAITKGLQSVRDLGLYAYKNEVSVCFRHPNPEIRKLSLVILIEWSLPGLGSFLDEALRDCEPSVRALALSWLGEESYPETFEALCEMARRGPSPEFDAAMKAIEISTTGRECDFISDFVLEKIWRSPFQGLTRLHELEDNLDEYREIAYRKHEESAQRLVDEYDRLRREFDSYQKLFDSLCGTIGKLRCGRVVPELVATLRSPEKLGLTGVPWNIPTWEQKKPRLDYSGVFSKLANALGAIGDRRATKPLIECLHEAPDDWQSAALNALGTLRDDDAVDEIKPFLSHKYLHETAFRALSIIGSDRAYRVIEEHYTKALGEPEMKDELHRMEYQLIRNNASRFEETVVALLWSNKYSRHNRGFLNALGSIATAKSVDSLFSFSSNPDNYEQAGFILSKVMTPEASEKARSLLASQNPIEVAFVITALWARSNDAYATLEKFEQNKDPHVRSAVAGIYFQRKDRMRLRKFADDESREVKELVFFAFHDARKASLENQLVASPEECKRGHLMVTDEALVITQGYQLNIAFPDEVLRAVISKEGDNSGIFVVIRKDRREEKFLVAPLKIGGYLANNPEEAYSSVLDLTKRRSPPIHSGDERHLLSGMWSEILKKREAKAAAERVENQDENPRETWEEGFL